MHWKVPLYIALAAAVLLLLPGALAQPATKPSTCPGDLVLGGDTTSPPDGIDEYALELHVSTVNNPGTWAGFTTLRPSDWLPAERGVMIAEAGACQKQSGWAFRTWEGGENTEYHFAGTNPPTGGGDGLNGYRTAGPSPTTVGGAPGVVTNYEIENGKDRFMIRQVLSLHGTDRQNILIHMGYEVCNGSPGKAQFGLKNFVAAQTGTNVNTIFANPFDEYGAKQKPAWSDNQTKYVDFTTYAAHHMGTTTTGSPINLVALLRDHEGFNAPPGQGGVPMDATTPTAYYFWAEDMLQPTFDPPTGGGTLTDGAIAWFWGANQSNPITIDGVGTEGMCWEGHAYIGVDGQSIVPPREPPSNQPPVARIAADTTYVSCTDSAVRFSAWESSDDNDTTGKPTRLAWTFGDGSKWPETGSYAPFTDANINRTKTYNDPGTYNVVLQVWDGALLTGITQSAIEVVGDPNCAPQVEPLPQQQPEAGSRIEIRVHATDHEDDRLRFTLQGAPSFLSIHARTGIITGLVPTAAGSYAFQVCVSDDWPGNDPSCTVLEIAVGDAPPRDTSSDQDADGIADRADNCYLIPNWNQADRDGDGIGDACDAPDPEQEIPGTPAPEDGSAVRCDLALDGDMDGDGIADPCDMDIDGDGILERGTPFLDNCPFVANPGQHDKDGDGIGDACDGTDGFGYATLSQEGLACTGCPDAETFQEAPTRLESRGFGLVGLGLVLGLAIAGAAVAVFLLSRRR